uniref:Uncharacterized protein n=1 Tax=Anguilla anguilla TaxID=7936 RepID=A0A0E9U5R5_ANGAN
MLHMHDPRGQICILDAFSEANVPIAVNTDLQFASTAPSPLQIPMVSLDSAMQHIFSL